jgi:hypothetical protein
MSQDLDFGPSLICSAESGTSLVFDHADGTVTALSYLDLDCMRLDGDELSLLWCDKSKVVIKAQPHDLQTILEHIKDMTARRIRESVNAPQGDGNTDVRVERLIFKLSPLRLREHTFVLQS